MNKIALTAILVLAASPVFAQAGNFTLVNGTAKALSQLSIRRAGTQDWKSLAGAAAPGARSPITFKDPDCAFDISAKVNGSPVTWAGVNLCAVKSVVLKNDESTGAWVDYDQ